jgi:hypothetical protein
MAQERTELWELDLRALPLEPLLRQAVAPDLESASTAWRLLGTMARNDRPEAGVFLLGLMHVHRDDLARMTELLRAVSFFPSAAAAEAVAAEFHRVASSASTRSYLNVVLETLTRFPSPLAGEVLQRLAADTRLSPKWRRRCEEATWRLGA